MGMTVATEIAIEGLKPASYATYMQHFKCYKNSRFLNKISFSPKTGLLTLTTPVGWWNGFHKITGLAKSASKEKVLHSCKWLIRTYMADYEVCVRACPHRLLMSVQVMVLLLVPILLVTLVLCWQNRFFYLYILVQLLLLLSSTCQILCRAILHILWIRWLVSG